MAVSLRAVKWTSVRASGTLWACLIMHRAVPRAAGVLSGERPCLWRHARRFWSNGGDNGSERAESLRRRRAAVQDIHSEAAKGYSPFQPRFVWVAPDPTGRLTFAELSRRCPGDTQDNW